MAGFSIEQMSQNKHKDAATVRRTTQCSNTEAFQLGPDTETGNIEVGKTAVEHMDIETGKH